MPRAINLIGHTYGTLTVVGRLHPTPSGRVWNCSCACGGAAKKITSALRSHPNPGCSQCEFERRGAVHRTHGGKRGPHRKLYQVWKGMRSRCRDKGNSSFTYYGGKGIGICPSWSAFEVFRDWALSSGYRAGLSIDRLDSDADYSPENCEWVTRGENSRRARIGMAA